MPPATPPSFSTERLVFRAPEPSDCAQPDGFLYKLLNSESVQHGLTATAFRPRQKADIDKWIANAIATCSIYSVFCLRDDDQDSSKSAMDLEPVGWITLDQIMVPHRKATFGLAIAPKHQGQGYAKEALEWLLERAFDGFGLNKVEGEVFGWNERALRSYKSVGFVVEGQRRQTIWQNGAFVDDYMIGLLASEWRERHHKS